MFEGPEFYGSTTVGERGQVVLPVKMRKRFGINPGEQLIVLGIPGAEAETGRIMLIKAESLNKVLVIMEEHQQAIRKIIDKNGKTGKKAKRD